MAPALSSALMAIGAEGSSSLGLDQGLQSLAHYSGISSPAVPLPSSCASSVAVGLESGVVSGTW